MKLLSAALCAVLALTALSCKKTKPPLPNVAAPANFKVDFDTTKGHVIVEISRALAPIGVDRFYNLVQAKYFDGARFFRVVPGFVVQFGLAADPDIIRQWDQPIAG